MLQPAAARSADACHTGSSICRAERAVSVITLIRKCGGWTCVPLVYCRLFMHLCSLACLAHAPDIRDTNCIIFLAQNKTLPNSTLHSLHQGQQQHTNQPARQRSRGLLLARGSITRIESTCAPPWQLGSSIQCCKWLHRRLPRVGNALHQLLVCHCTRTFAGVNSSLSIVTPTILLLAPFNGASFTESRLLCRECLPMVQLTDSANQNIKSQPALRTTEYTK